MLNNTVFALNERETSKYNIIAIICQTKRKSKEHLNAKVEKKGSCCDFMLSGLFVQ